MERANGERVVVFRWSSDFAEQFDACDELFPGRLGLGDARYSTSSPRRQLGRFCHLDGVMVTEKELVGECLTSEDGTEPLAVYRALRIYSGEIGQKPKLASRDPSSWQRLGQFPVLAMVSPVDTERATPTSTGRLRSLLGRSSEGHAVVILGHNSDGNYVVGDPSNGRVIWSPRQMAGYFSGQAIYLERVAR